MNPNLNNVQVIILAAGRGKRMESDDPKALALLRGKPFLKHILDTLDTISFPIKPVIVVGHKKERIFEVLGNEHNYAHQAEQLGTGHAVLSAQEKIHKDHQTIFIILADQPLLSKETILDVLDAHQKNNSTVTIGTIVVPDFDGWRSGMEHFGRIIRNEKGEVLKNVEYKDATPEERAGKEVNPSIYAFDKEWLWTNIDKLKNENVQGEYYLTDMIGLAHEQGEKIVAIPIQNVLEGIQPNSKEELVALEHLLENGTHSQ